MCLHSLQFLCVLNEKKRKIQELEDEIERGGRDSPRRQDQIESDGEDDGDDGQLQRYNAADSVRIDSSQAPPTSSASASSTTRSRGVGGGADSGVVGGGGGGGDASALPVGGPPQTATLTVETQEEHTEDVRSAGHGAGIDGGVAAVGGGRGGDDDSQEQTDDSFFADYM